MRLRAECSLSLCWFAGLHGQGSLGKCWFDMDNATSHGLPGCLWQNAQKAALRAGNEKGDHITGLKNARNVPDLPGDPWLCCLSLTLCSRAAPPRFAWRAPRRAAASRQQGLTTLGNGFVIKTPVGGKRRSGPRSPAIPDERLHRRSYFSRRLS